MTRKNNDKRPLHPFTSTAFIPAWKFYLRFYHGSFGSLLLSMIISAAQSLLILPIAFLVRLIFDHIIPTGDFRRLVFVGIAILILNVTNSAVTLFTRYLTLKTTKLAIRELRNKLLSTCYRFSRSFYSTIDKSKLHASIVQDTERVDVMSNALVVQFLPSLIITIGLSSVLIYLNWVLYLILLIIAPPLWLVNRSVGKRSKNNVNAFRRCFETYSKGILFVLQMMDLTKIQTAEQIEIARQKQNIEELRTTSAFMAWLNAAYSFVQSGIVAFSGMLILVIGGAAVARGAMTLGSLLSFYVAVGLLNSSLQTLLSAIQQLIIGNESLLSLYQISQAVDSVPYKGRRQISFTGEIILDSVCFRYHKEWIVQDVNLIIQKNAIIALTGPNGSGKSTIANLMMGFYKPQKGCLYADGHSYHKLDIVHLRQSIGYVMQDPIIFSGTIWENITYGYPDASQEQVERACSLATAGEFIHELEQGYDTLVGENGILISGGQRQRIAIARALLRQPKLLILDEPANHLDETAVHHLVRNLLDVDGSPSILMIMHDMKFIRLVQSVYILREGGYVEKREHS